MKFDLSYCCKFSARHYTSEYKDLKYKRKNKINSIYGIFALNQPYFSYSSCERILKNKLL